MVASGDTFCSELCQQSATRFCTIPSFLSRVSLPIGRPSLEQLSPMIARVSRCVMGLADFMEQAFTDYWCALTPARYVIQRLKHLGLGGAWVSIQKAPWI